MPAAQPRNGTPCGWGSEGWLNIRRDGCGGTRRRKPTTYAKTAHVIQSVRTALEKRSADTEESKDVEGVLEILHEHRPKLRTLEWCCLGCRQHMKTQALIMLEHAPLCDDDAETPADESAAFAAHAADGVAGVAAPRQTRGQQAAAPLLLFAQLNDRAATGVGATPQAEAVLQRKWDWLTSLWDSLDDKSAVQLASTCKALWSADDFTAKRSRAAAWFAFTLEESKAKLDDVRRQKNKALRKLKGEKKDKKNRAGKVLEAEAAAAKAAEATQAAEAAAQAAASTVAEQLVELSKLRQHYAAEVAAVNNLERELRASDAATQAETTALSSSLCDVRISLWTRSPSGRPMIAPPYHVDLVRQHCFVYTAFNKCLHNLCASISATGAEIAEDIGELSGEWVSMLATVEAAETSRLELAYRVQLAMQGCHDQPELVKPDWGQRLTPPVRDNTYPRLARPECDGGDWIRDQLPLSYDQYVDLPVEAWYEAGAQYAQLSGDLPYDFSAPPRTERGYLQQTGRQGGLQSYTMLLLAEIQQVFLAVAADATSNMNDHNVTAVFFGGPPLTAPGQLVLLDGQEVHGEGGAKGDSRIMYEAVRDLGYRGLSIDDIHPLENVSILNFATFDSDGCGSQRGDVNGVHVHLGTRFHDTQCRNKVPYRFNCPCLHDCIGGVSLTHHRGVFSQSKFGTAF
jgi:hypothetical protein